jgi:hypothetical protein
MAVLHSKLLTLSDALRWCAASAFLRSCEHVTTGNARCNRRLAAFTRAAPCAGQSSLALPASAPGGSQLLPYQASNIDRS